MQIQRGTIQRLRGVIRLTGEHDLTTEAEIRRALHSELDVSPFVIVDLARVSSLDSTVIAALVATHMHAEARVRVLAIVLPPHAHHPARRVLELTGVLASLRTFPGIVEAQTAARAAVRAPAP